LHADWKIESKRKSTGRASELVNARRRFWSPKE
jgi:hypothetical protein